MLKPYVYLVTGKSKDVTRDAPDGARVSVNFPEMGRTIELNVDGEGRYTVEDRPAPGHGGLPTEIARGQLEER